MRFPTSRHNCDGKHSEKKNLLVLENGPNPETRTQFDIKKPQKCLREFMQGVLSFPIVKEEGKSRGELSRWSTSTGW